jgi:alkylation response protein AidB-like acyl-CoA dehydrogenase
MGYIRETAIERRTRDTRVHSIGGGATEVMCSRKSPSAWFETLGRL